MTTMYISPYRRIASLRDAMDRFLEESYRDSNTSEREMLLAVDVSSEDEGYVIKALVPGLESENLDIEILNNTVSIQGEFKSGEDEETKYLTCELPQGHFNRTIALPVAVDASKAEASLKNGVLTLRIPKAEAHRPKSIKVQSA